MVRIYLRYKQKEVFGVIASYPSNVVYDSTRKLAITGSLEYVSIWNVKKGTQVRRYIDTKDTRRKALVTRLCLFKDDTRLAAGYVIFYINITLILFYIVAMMMEPLEYGT